MARRVETHLASTTFAVAGEDLAEEEWEAEVEAGVFLNNLSLLLQTQYTPQR